MTTNPLHFCPSYYGLNSFHYADWLAAGCWFFFANSFFIFDSAWFSRFLPLESSTVRGAGSATHDVEGTRILDVVAEFAAFIVVVQRRVDWRTVSRGLEGIPFLHRVCVPLLFFFRGFFMTNCSWACGWWISRGLFCRQKFGTVTHFNGRPLQLQLLYNAVVTRGGWQKVKFCFFPCSVSKVDWLIWRLSFVE